MTVGSTQGGRDALAIDSCDVHCAVCPARSCVAQGMDLRASTRSRSKSQCFPLRLPVGTPTERVESGLGFKTGAPLLQQL